MAKKKPAVKTKDKLNCFVIIGFGMKTDYATGRTLNLDLTYQKLIKPAFDSVGIRCFRAIDVNVTGSIDKLMYKWIYHADFVVADLSTMNANVFYELGVRHAQRPKTTLIMAENEMFKMLPFDLSHTIIYGYEHLGEEIADKEATRFVGLLSDQLRKLVESPMEEDSPVFTYLPGMVAPQWTDPKELITELRTKLAEQAAGEPGDIKDQSLAIIVERIWSLQVRKVLPRNLVAQVWRWEKINQLNDQHLQELQSSSPLGSILAAGIINRNESRDVMKDSIEDTGRPVVHGLERYLKSLGTIAAITPLLGLLGTVIGMIKVFSSIMVHGVGDANQLAGGISEALITTAAGLMIGIPALVAYNWLNGRADRIIFDLEYYSSKVLDTLRKRQKQKLSGAGDPA